jgi:hypothetical protein
MRSNGFRKSTQKFSFRLQLSIFRAFVGIRGLQWVASVYTRVVVAKGAYAFKKSVFKKNYSIVAWQKWKMIWPDARYACLVKIRVITQPHTQAEKGKCQVTFLL